LLKECGQAVDSDEEDEKGKKAKKGKNKKDSQEPTLGDEVEAIAGAALAVAGKEYYGPGDVGRVSKDLYADEKDGIERFEVTWYRTGLTSTMTKEAWAKNFNLIGNNITLPHLGDEVEALPSVELVIEGKEYYKAGDKGRMSKDVFATESDGVERFEITWYRSGLTSTMRKDAWLKNIRYIAAGIEVPHLGDEVEALPGVSLNVSGKDYYKAGDQGCVSKAMYTAESDGVDRFEVTWYRTGLTSTMKQDAWLKNFLFIAVGIEVPGLGDEMEALPGISLNVSGKDYYESGDKGRVSKDAYVTEGDGIERFEIHWYRTGLTSTMKTDAWLKNFRLIGSNAQAALSSLKPSELQKRALAGGANSEEIEEALDDDKDPKQALIALILSKSKNHKKESD